jgi:hypothetical protein
MIARIWHGWAPQATADDYQRHYESDVIPRLEEVMFTSITFFTGIDAVRGFAGEDYEQAVVEDPARRALSRWDERVSYDEVVLEFP